MALLPAAVVVHEPTHCVAPAHDVPLSLNVSGTPPEIVERLNREANAALADPAVRARLAELGSEPLPGSPGEFAKLIAEETEKWSEVVKFAGLKAD